MLLRPFVCTRASFGHMREPWCAHHPVRCFGVLQRLSRKARYRRGFSYPLRPIPVSRNKSWAPTLALGIRSNGRLQPADIGEGISAGPMLMPAPRYIVENGVLVLLDEAGNELAEYRLSPWQTPAEVAAWLAKKVLPGET